MVASHLTAAANINAESANHPVEVYDLGREVETGAQRVRRLQHEAHALAREQVEAYANDLIAMAQRAAEIAEGGEAYPIGVRELASRVADDLPQKAQSLMSIMNRAPHD